LVTWQFALSLLIGAVLQWWSLSFARRLGMRRGRSQGRHEGFCVGYASGGTAAIEIMSRLSEGNTRGELEAVRDQMLAEFQAVKH
jgi:hypothetical protein